MFRPSSGSPPRQPPSSSRGQVIHPPTQGCVVADAPLSYHDRLDRRPLTRIGLVVIHCTELPDLATAREYAERILYGSGTGNSGHFYIDRDGTIVQYVALDRVAHHVRGHNRGSVGIELVNQGRYPNWYDSGSQEMTQPYTGAQYESLACLLDLLSRSSTRRLHLVRHSDLDQSFQPAEDRPNLLVRRKLDPGPLFDWNGLRRWFARVQRPLF